MRVELYGLTSFSGLHFTMFSGPLLHLALPATHHLLYGVTLLLGWSPLPIPFSLTHTRTHFHLFLTSVAKRFAAEYGCLRLSVGEAMRRVIEQFPESELTRLMQSFLQAGQVVPDDLCVLALERTLLDVQCNTRGWVAKGLTWLSEFAIAWSILGSIGGVLCWRGKV